MDFPGDGDDISRTSQEPPPDGNGDRPPSVRTEPNDDLSQTSRAELVNKVRLSIQQSVNTGLRTTIVPHVEVAGPEIRDRIRLPRTPLALLYEQSSSPEPDNDTVDYIPGWKSVQEAIRRLFPMNRFKVYRLLEFNPDDPNVDIEGWCELTEHIVTKREMSSTELLMSLAQALKGRAASVLTRLKTINNITWPLVKDLLLSTFSRSRSIKDYFEVALKFEIRSLETFPNSASRLWHLLEQVPRFNVPEDVMAGLVTAILCRKHPMINRELRAKTITSKADLIRALSAISSARRLRPSELEDREYGSSEKRPRPGSRYIAKCNKCKNRIYIRI